MKIKCLNESPKSVTIKTLKPGDVFYWPLNSDEILGIDSAKGNFYLLVENNNNEKFVAINLRKNTIFDCFEVDEEVYFCYAEIHIDMPLLINLFN